MTALDHRVLRQFLAIADHGTVRAAARALHMSQPPLTAAIAQLEDRLGVSLFDRSVRGMHLTDAGAVLRDEARTIVGRLNHLEERVRHIGGNPRPLRLGFVSAALNAVLPTLLRGLRKRDFPTPFLSEMTTPEQVAALRDGNLDAGFLHPPVPLPEGIAARSLGRDPFCAALPAGHRLVGRGAIRFAEIASEPFVLFPDHQGPDLHATIRALAHAAGSDLVVAAETPRIHSQLALVAGGLGVGLITRSTAAVLTFEGVSVVDLTDTADRLFLDLHLAAPPMVLQDLDRILSDPSHI